MAKFHPQKVYLIDGARTPFGQHLRQSTNSTRSYSKLDLGLLAAKNLLLKQPFSAVQLDDVVIASSTPSDNNDLAQHLSKRLHCKNTLNAHTFSSGENCGLQAFEYAHQQIAFQQKALILIGGIEVFESKAVALTPELSQWVRKWQSTSGLFKKLGTLSTLYNPHVIHHTDSNQQQRLQQREIAEKIASHFSLSTEAMSEYVKLSQRRLKYAQRNSFIKNVVPLFYPDGTSLHRDEDIIHSEDQLKQPLKTGIPPTGVITKTSMTQATDGACVLLLANQATLDQYQLTPLAELSAPVWSNNDRAVETLLKDKQPEASEINYWEWDETSAAEILALEKKPQLDTIEAFQTLNTVNIDGGSLALGRPNTANNLRCILQLASILQRHQAPYGVCHFGFSSRQQSALLLRARPNQQETKTAEAEGLNT
ncbi:MAG: hypothetical protein KAG28_01765 [Cocleimonas sp.]|nr:hypothetical protein [Cocleimonas sp.]